MRVAIDTGGTFTDCVYLAAGELQVLKVFSTPGDPSQAVLDGLARISAGKALDVRHGTTVGTNTMLERKGARVAFVTTAGFEDTISIGRQTRSKLYDWFAPLPVCLVPRSLRFGVPERVSAEGEILRSPTDEELESLVNQVRGSGAEAVAISLLFSFANPETERRVEEALRPLGLPISASHRILPEFREYERASTTVVNAYLAPRMQNYLLHLEQSVASHHGGGRVDVMQSSGGIISARSAAPEPVRTVLSGPAGGVIGACHVARWAGFERIIGFDMGGTSTDVFLSDAATGGALLTRESMVAGVPVSMPMLDIHTAGAGGGSIARFDAGGMLRVGPESAGAQPGPICFGRGTMPTVTDANFLLGRLDQDSFLGGGVRLDQPRTAQIMREKKGPLRQRRRIRSRHTPRRRNTNGESHPRDLCRAWARSTAIHAGGLWWRRPAARLLAGPRSAHSHRPGSRHARRAIGNWYFARRRGARLFPHGDVAGRCDRRLSKTASRNWSSAASPSSLPKVCRVWLSAQWTCATARQGYELNVPYQKQSPAQSIAAFHQLHQQRYGFCDVSKPVEIVNLRLRMTAAGEPYAPAYREPVPAMAVLPAMRSARYTSRVTSCLRATTGAKPWPPETPFTGLR